MPRGRDLADDARLQGAPHLSLQGLPPSLCAYSVRRIGAYAGPCMRVRRSSDDAEADIGFADTGDLNIAALAHHCGSGSGFVRTWYDQSGFGRNIIQATSGRQPAIYVDGVVQQTAGGRPALQGTAGSGTSGSLLRSANTLPTSYATCTLSTVIEIPTGSENNRTIFGWADGANDRTYGKDGSLQFGRWYYSTGIKFGSNDADSELNGFEVDRPIVFHNQFTATSDARTGIRANGVLGGGTSGHGTRTFGGAGESRFLLSFAQDDGASFEGKISEVILWGESLDLARGRILAQDQAAYYRSVRRWWP